MEGQAVISPAVLARYADATAQEVGSEGQRSVAECLVRVANVTLSSVEVPIDAIDAPPAKQ